MEKWIERARRRLENAPCIEEVLFGQPFAPYAFRRLQYFALTHGIQLLFHLIEFRILLEMLGAKNFGFYFFLRATLLFLSGFWWGGLEAFRKEIRQTHREGQSYKIPRIHSRWRAFPDTLMFGSLLTVVLVGMGFVIFGGEPSFVTTLCLICGISFALNLKLRWLHSGVYAIRRVYLSAWALILSRAIFPILILSLYPWLGKWSLVVALIGAELVQVGVTLHFIKKSYRALRFDFPRFWKLQLDGKRAFTFLKRKDFRWAGLSQGLTRLDFAIVGFVFLFLAIQGQGNSASKELQLAVLISPFLIVCSDWGRLFYFDFKKLEIDSLQGFRGKFERQVETLSYLVACICWLLFILAYRLLVGPITFGLSSVVFLLFLAVSLFSYQQIHAFSAGRFPELVKASMTIILGVVIFAGISGAWGILALSLSAFWATRDLRSIKWVSSDRERKEDSKILPFSDWLQFAKKENAKISMASVTTAEGLSLGKLTKLAQAFQDKLMGGSVCLLPNKRIVWFSSGTQLTSKEVSLLGTDLLRGYQTTHEHLLFDSAWREFMERNFSGGFLLPKIECFSDQDLLAEFHRLFPDGEVFEVGSASLRKKSRGEMRGIYREALRAARWLPFDRKREKQGVSILTEKRILKWVFVVGQSSEKKIRQWRRILTWRQTVSILHEVAMPPLQSDEVLLEPLSGARSGPETRS